MKVTDENRDKLISLLVDEIIEGMDTPALETIAEEYLKENKESLSNEELEKQIEDFYPHLLDDEDEDEEG